MNYKAKAQLTDQEIKHYYQGKLLDDADELSLYDEYIEWLTKHRNLNDLKELNDHFDNALHTIATANLEGNKIDAFEYAKSKLTNE